MPFPLISFCSYLTSSDSPWRGVDYDSSIFVKAVKGTTFKGYANILIDGVPFSLNQQTKDEAVMRFADWAARRLTYFTKDGPIALIPIPGHDTLVTSTTPCRASRIAITIQLRLPSSQVVDVLRWDQTMTPSHKQGPRDPAHLYPHLKALRLPACARRVVIVDDVVTKGGHLQACAAVLRKLGLDPLAAITVGRTTLEQLADPFQVPLEDLPDYDPDRTPSLF